MPKKQSVNKRIKLAFYGIIGCLVLISARLFYWQVIKAQTLQSEAARQTIFHNTIEGDRGKIYTADNSLLVGNQTVYDLYVNTREINIDQLDLINRLVDIFDNYYQQLDAQAIPVHPATDAQNSGQQPVSEQQAGEQQSNEGQTDGDTQETSDAQKTNDTQQINVPRNSTLNKKFDPDQFRESLTAVFSNTESRVWFRLQRRLSPQLKTEIEAANIQGLHLIEKQLRYYPEGSMAAHVSGFLGEDESGQNIGYFGIEGALNKELQGRSKSITYRRDAVGRQMADQKLDFSNLDGRDVTLSIRRDIQFIANSTLIKGIKNSGSLSGEIVVMDPKTGAILALAAWPNYDPAHYYQYSTESYRNPALTNLFEPGSIFKIFTLAAGLDSNTISPNTICTRCDGPRVIGEHTIKTWNDEYNPGINMTDALKKSDNTALVFAVEQIGHDNFVEYLQKFGIGEALNIDLQEDRSSPLKTKFRRVELANASFGQGFYTNVLQIVRAAGAIANQGKMMKPYIVEQVTDGQTQKTIEHEPEVLREVLSPETASTLTTMMVKAAPERNNLINQNYTVAGKTGTAQIASQEGGYREQGTIASYIGFAPAENPKFVMMVKLNEPSISPWAEATAVPIWYEAADKIILAL